MFNFLKNIFRGSNKNITMDDLKLLGKEYQSLFLEIVLCKMKRLKMIKNPIPALDK